MYKSYLWILLIAVFSSCTNKQAASPSFYIDKQEEKKIDVLLSKMTIEEKVGQTCQITLDAILQKDESNKLIEPHQIDLKKLDEAINKFKVGSVLNVSNHTFTLNKWNGMVLFMAKCSKTKEKIPGYIEIFLDR